MFNSDIKGTATLREKHKFEIMNYIRQYGPITRTKLCQETKISKATVTRVVEKLVSEGIVEEVGLGENSSAGRKPIYIQLRPSSYCCIGINITRNSIRGCAIDLGKNIIVEKKVSIKSVDKENVFLKNVLSIISLLIEESKFTKEQILGIGIGAPGIVDYDQGILVDFNPRLGMKNIALREYLQERFSLPVYVDNNPNTRVLGEYWYGYGKGYSDIAYIVCSEGIGAGIITDHKILRGKHNITGEFGHMTVNVGGRKCNCGRNGCVEAYCSTEVIEQLVSTRIYQQESSALLEYIKKHNTTISYALVAAFYDRDPICKEAIDNAIQVLSIGLSNLMGIQNPEIIIFSGEFFQNTTFFDIVVEKTKEHLFNSHIGKIEYRLRETEDYIYGMGAAALVYKAFFYNEES